MIDAVAPGHAAALARWRALLVDLHHCVSCNLRVALQVALEHAEELHTVDGFNLVRLDDGDDASNFLRVDLGVRSPRTSPARSLCRRWARRSLPPTPAADPGSVRRLARHLGCGRPSARRALRPGRSGPGHLH